MQGMVGSRAFTSLALPQPVAVTCTLQGGEDGDGDGEPNLEGQGVPRLHHTAGKQLRQALKITAVSRGWLELKVCCNAGHVVVCPSLWQVLCATFCSEDNVPSQGWSTHVCL